MKRNWVTGLFFGAALAATALTPSMAAADTLFKAMEKAYLTNPTLNAARAGQRATDELVPQALSGWRPSVTVQSTLQSETVNTNIKSTANPSGDWQQDTTRSGNMQIVLSQPLFRGFRTVEGTKSAEAQVDAGRQNLLQTEQQVLFNVVQAYMNVYAGRQFVALRRQDVAALQAQVKASNERFKVGEITRTDVAQSEARLAESRTALADAQSQLAQAVSFYVQMVGSEPGKLSYPKVGKVPASLQAALDAGGEINPRLLARSFVEIAANSQIGVARSGLLPSAALQAVGATTDKDFSADNSGIRSLTVSATVSIPLYESGLVYSEVREAKQRASQSRIEVIEVARDVRNAIAQSWNAYVSLAEIIQNTRTQVDAARLALSGVQQEYQAGTRTTLDVLNAQREVISAQVLQVNAEKNRVVAGYQLLAAIGRLTAQDVGLDVPLYDPEENYRRVRNKWIGTDVKTVE